MQKFHVDKQVLMFGGDMYSKLLFTAFSGRFELIKVLFKFVVRVHFNVDNRTDRQTLLEF